jgi:hypothetical protein
MTLARRTTEPGREFEIVQFTDAAKWVLRDEHNDVVVFEESSLLERLEIRCDFCGRWPTDAAPVTAGGSSCDVLRRKRSLSIQRRLGAYRARPMNPMTLRYRQKRPSQQGLFAIGAPRFELGTSSPPD